MERVVPFLADTSGHFEQLFGAEHTALSLQGCIQKKKHALKKIKKQAIDQDMPRNDFYGLLGFNEASRDHWRVSHMAAWRATVRPLKVVNMPNEVLAMIFARFGDVPEPKIQVYNAPSEDHPLPSPDVESIKNIRLTCRAFRDVSSAFLLPLVSISFTASSLQRLEKISNHPTISKGVRIIRVYAGTYSPVSTNINLFRSQIIFRLVTLRVKLLIEASRIEKEVEEACRVIGIPPLPKFLKINGLQMALAEAEDVIQTLRRQTSQDDHPVASHDPFETRIRKATEQAHEEYRRKYLDQKNLIEDRHLHAKILAAIRKMPSVQRLCITNSTIQRLNDNIRSGWDQRLDVKKFKAILRSPNPFRKLMVAGDGDMKRMSRVTDSDSTLWYELPLMLGVGDGNLTQLDITIMAFDEPHIKALARHLPSIRHACRRLRRVQVKITQRFAISRQRIKPVFVAQTWGLLDAMLTSPKLEAVRLDLEVGHEYHDVHSHSGFGAVLANLPWNNLRHVCLLQLPIGIEDLRDALEKVPQKVHLELTAINLLDGTWIEALEILRSRADASSLVRQPRGVELTQMSEKEAQYLQYEFDSEHRDGWYSAQRCPGPTSFYIQGGNIPNPLIWSNE